MSTHQSNLTFLSCQCWDNEASSAPILGWGLNLSHFSHFIPGCTYFLQSSLGYETGTKNIRFCTRMYRISKILRGEQARINRWIYERTISNTLSNLTLESTSTTLTYKTYIIRFLDWHTPAASYLLKYIFIKFLSHFPCGTYDVKYVCNNDLKLTQVAWKLLWSI